MIMHAPDVEKHFLQQAFPANVLYRNPQDHTRMTIKYLPPAVYCSHVATIEAGNLLLLVCNYFYGEIDNPRNIQHASDSLHWVGALASLPADASSHACMHLDVYSFQGELYT